MEDNERYRKVNEYPALIKDTTSNAILNTDNGGLAAYKRQKRLLASAQTNNDRIEKVEQEVSEIKNLLTQILGKLG